MNIKNSRRHFLPKKYNIPDSSKAILLDFSEPQSLENTKGWSEVAKAVAGGAAGTAAVNTGLGAYKISLNTQLNDVVKFAKSAGVSQPIVDAHAEQALDALKSHITRGASVFLVGTGGAIAAIEVADKYFELGWSTRKKLITAATIGLAILGGYFLLVTIGVLV